jgi:outer membrane scaffolding protein for murein synthesis (MipA/OmpV family)
MFWRYQSLRGAEFEDSPLVETQDYYLLGAGFSWIFAGNL